MVLAFPVTIISNHFADIQNEQLHEKEEKEAPATREGHADEYTDRELSRILRTQLRMQADAINELQVQLDTVGNRWRIIEATAHVLEQRHMARELESVSRERERIDSKNKDHEMYA